jgi:hypothetical protein
MKRNGGGSIWTNSPAMPQEHGDSATQNTSVGSGSRPTKSKFAIDTSAPEDAHTQGRSVEGWLK